MKSAHPLKQPWPVANEPLRENVSPCPTCGELLMRGTSHFFMNRGGGITGSVIFCCGYSAKVAPSLYGYHVERLSECSRGSRLKAPQSEKEST